MTGTFDPHIEQRQVQEREAAQTKLTALLASPTLRVVALATTGLRNAVPVQFVVLDGQGGVLLDTRCFTTQPIEPDAQAMHSVKAADLEHAPSLATCLRQFEDLTSAGHDVVLFAAPWMVESIVRACRAEGVEAFGMGHWQSGQELLTPICGTYNWTSGKWRPLKLTDAIGDLAVPGDFAAIGTALGNAQRLAFVLRHHGAGQVAVAPEEVQEDLGNWGADECARCGWPVQACVCVVDA
ncbi:hypothetical protein GO986_17770 [Deinococcus sp. HMF7620]|uniref:Uncharacterized protein n=1 Tax=Deinococcus arboris TaxID=2682977 RepID=A0A7C9HTX0_9DEIO|nr:hypothetical protein [Deinococcus arboris]MVN88587.1 hypothetical protein [Deinococcus arboris]